MDESQRSVPLSPVTGKKAAVLVDSISVSEVIEAYRELDIDVENSFQGQLDLPVYRCKDTGYRFFYPHSLAGKSDFYQKLQRKGGYYAEWRWEHEQSISALTHCNKIIEIGCGTGNFLKKLRDQHDKHVSGLEFNPNAIKVAKEQNLDVYDIRVEDFSRQHKAQFDAVCTFQVLEHVPDVRGFLNGACNLLKPNGILIVGVPNNNPYLFKFDKLHALNLPPHHMGLWDKSSLKLLANHFPLKLIEVRSEPLFDHGYFWEVYLKHLHAKHSPLFYVFNKMPWRVSQWLQLLAKKYVPGRNLFASYKKMVS